MTSVEEHIAAIEAASRMLAADAAPAVRITCQEILERCFLLRWYEGIEDAAVPPALSELED